MSANSFTFPKQARVAFVSLGCRTNRADTDVMASELSRLGCNIVDADQAEFIIINTCAVTGEAESKARKACRHALMTPGVKGVVATGCVAALHADSLAKACPGLVVVADKRKVASQVMELLALLSDVPRATSTMHNCNTMSKVSSSSLQRLQKPDALLRSGLRTPTGRTRPTIKIQDGCNLRCTYCIVWKARGPAVSVPAAEIINAVDLAATSGFGEVVLTGINVGSYYDPAVGKLSDLLSSILAQTSIGRIRLASIEPGDVSNDLLATMAASQGRIAPFLHICLQSGSDTTLERMGRIYTVSHFSSVVQRARSIIADIALGTDVIVGFPGETDEEFRESLAFCQWCSFSRMHVFRFSARPGTSAATMPHMIDSRVSSERALTMRELASEMRKRFAQSRVGQRELVLVQAEGQGITGGLLDAHIDEKAPIGSLVPVQVRATSGDTLICV